MEPEKNDERQRLFVAVEMPEDVQKHLADVCNQFAQKKLFSGRYTRPENFHVTLKFFGEVSPDVVPEIDAALESISFSKVDAHLGALDVLPDREKMRILFVHLVCPELMLLAQQIEDVLGDRFDRENRNFKSHVTLARIKTVEDKTALLKELENIVMPLMQWTIDSFILQRSVLTREGPVYSVVKRYLLF